MKENNEEKYSLMTLIGERRFSWERVREKYRPLHLVSIETST